MTQYSRVWVSGEQLDSYTAQAVAQTKAIYKVLGGTGSVTIAQGSYNAGGVAASAGTHDGGGAVDFSLTVKNSKNWQILQKAARMCMFAAWHRTPDQGPWGDHVHSILIGNTKASAGAKAQVTDYYAHKSGLVGHRPDPTWHPSVLFKSKWKLGTVNLAVVIKEAKKTRNYIYKPGVARIQRALNLKLGTTLRVDGLYGNKTQAAYKRWEISVGGTDGIPGPYSLPLLGAGLFNVT